MGVSKRKHGEITVLNVEGDFFGDSETDKLEKAIEHEIEIGTRQLLMNLYSCRMMNSNALRVMIAAKKSFDSLGRQIRLCAIDRGNMKSLLVMVRLREWFDVSDTEKDAFAAFEGTNASA